MKDWTFSFQKINRPAKQWGTLLDSKMCNPSLDLVRISNHVLKGMIAANSWKKRRKLFQPNEINHGVFWVKTSKTLSKTFLKFEILFIFCVIILVEYFVLFKLHKCYCILINYFFNSTKVWLYNLYASIRLWEGRSAFVLYCT